MHKLKEKLLEVSSVSMSVNKPDGGKLKILDKIDLTLESDEIVAILGKSGSGKSTLLRIIAGLIQPTKGKVKFFQGSDDNLAAYSMRVSMVFQNFGLFPWLTVLENVELGLQALGCPEMERRSRALDAIKLIGLDGFAMAYPRELSGGMRQRVGIARSLVVNPEIILMDEPFSALDVLTSRTLKQDFMNVWSDDSMQLKSVIIVTHSIEEAVMLADRVFVLSSNPGMLISEVKINLPRPRKPDDAKFKAMVDKIYSEMSIVATSGVAALTKAHEGDINQKLPYVSPNHLSAVLDALNQSKNRGHANLADLVQDLQITTSEMLHIAEALSALKFAAVEDGTITLQKSGKLFAEAEVDKRKKIFAESVLVHVPLVAYIRKILHDRPDNKAPQIRFLALLEDHMTIEDAHATLKTVVAWGRYAELFSYDDNKQIFSLQNPSYPS